MEADARDKYYNIVYNVLIGVTKISYGVLEQNYFLEPMARTDRREKCNFSLQVCV